jgi:hypothetical protein
MHRSKENSETFYLKTLIGNSINSIDPKRTCSGRLHVPAPA